MTGRIDSLDGARAIAAMSVVVHHIYQQNWNGSLPEPVHLLLSWAGWWGVTLFFLLSGFCIHYPRAIARYNHDHTLNVRSFVRARLFRLVPAYLFTLALSLAIGALFPSNLLHPAAGWSDVALHVLFLHTFFPDSIHSINAVLWSLGVEIQFYILYALFYRWMNFNFRETFFILKIGLFYYFFVSVVFTGENKAIAQKAFISSF